MKIWETVKTVLETTKWKNFESYFWGDSKVALCWINGGDISRYKQFVYNRVKKIQESTKTLPWRHVPGVENPADLPTRGVKPNELLNIGENFTWKHGPHWLSQDENSWPKDLKIVDTEESMTETKIFHRKGFKNELNLKVSGKRAENYISSIINPEKFSRLKRLLRVTAYVKRFIYNARNPTKKKFGDLEIEDVREAEKLWVKDMQGTLIKDKNFDKLEAQFKIYEDSDSFLRSKGRIENSDFSLETTDPLVLPKHHHVVQLMIWDAHERTYHGGVNQTMNEIRQKYWVPTLRQLTRKLVHKCVICKKLEGKSYTRRIMPQLPDFRVKVANPFSVVAIDFAGPVWIKQNNSRRSPSVKAYITLFSCAYSRSLHIELTPDLSAETFVRCLKRFIGRRGCPKLCLSDNAKTFSAQETKSFLLDRNIDWYFHPPKSPWRNGLVERMVGITKRALKKGLSGARLSYEELETVLVEIEQTINNRPISYIDNDTIETAITPNHLLHGRRLDMVNNDTNIEPDIGDYPTRRLLYRQTLVAQFVDRWRRDYLLELRQRHNKDGKPATSVKEGDVVVIHDNGPRTLWRLGRVTKLNHSKDNEVRSVILKVGVRDKKYTTLERPIELVYPLEINSNVGEDVTPEYRGEEIELWESLEFGDNQFEEEDNNSNY